MFSRVSRSSNREQGFTLLEILVGLTILSIFLLAIIPLFVLSAKVLRQSNDKLIAANLANKELEKVRALSYDDVGITGGNPSGVLNSDYDKNADGKTFHIKIRVNWVDGDFDGLFPTDSDPRDYKRVVVTVSWPGATSPNQRAQVSTLVSRESEEKAASGGNIVVKAKDYQGNLLEDVKIQLTTGPSSPTSDWTDENGEAAFYLLNPSETEGDYTVVASKTGWIVRPDDQNQTCTVLVNQTRTLEFVLGKPGNLIVYLKDLTGNLVGKNSRITLVSTEAGTKEYTSHNGEFNISDVFPGTYDLTAWAASYKTSNAVAIEINPLSTTEINITLISVPTGGLHLTAYDQVSSSPVASATVKVTHKVTGNEVTGTTNSSGIYEEHFEEGEYQVEVSKNGYQTSRQDVIIIASQNTTLNVYLLMAPSYGSILVRTENRANGSPRDNVCIRVVGTDYDREQRTGSFAPGEALFDNLAPGTYTVYRWRSGWRDPTTLTVTVGQRERLVYRY